jgi:hypothetical protein
MTDLVETAVVVDTPEVREAQQQSEQQARDDRGRFAASEVRAVEDDPAPVETPAEPLVEQLAAPEPPAEEFEEVEWDGKKYTVPKPLKGGLMMQADYTRKTQEIAEQRKAIQQRAQEIEKAAQASQEEMQAQVALHSIDNEIKRYNAVDWDQFVTENPIEANKQWMRFQSLKDQRNDIAGEVTKRQSERAAAAERDIRQRLTAAQEHAMKLPGWSPEMDLRIIEYAKSRGASEQEIANAMSPAVYEILLDAELGAQVRKQRQTASAKPSAAVAKPTSTVGGRANPSAGKSLADMDMDDYVAARRKQMTAA